MFLDLLLAVVLFFAVLKGYRRGLIVGVFSFVAIIIGLAAAIKLSALAARYIGEAVKVSDRWLPVISFIVVFIIVVLLIRLGANLIQKTVEIGMLGWANRLGGIIFYVLIYIIVFSIIVFYAEQLNLIQPATIEKSITYSYVHPLGPKAINLLGAVVPIFKDMFAELTAFFDGVAQKAA